MKIQYFNIIMIVDVLVYILLEVHSLNFLLSTCNLLSLPMKNFISRLHNNLISLHNRSTYIYTTHVKQRRGHPKILFRLQMFFQCKVKHTHTQSYTLFNNKDKANATTRREFSLLPKRSATIDNRTKRLI